MADYDVWMAGYMEDGRAEADVRPGERYSGLKDLEGNDGRIYGIT